ncbi:hypothetical protein [Shewanella marisflavi]|uniref:hypothetical protein n=1 Tax=Shewanella marisflavi TaxID=260364 RepID=UPI003AAB2717
MNLKVIITAVLLAVASGGTMSNAMAVSKGKPVFSPDVAMDCIYDAANERWICAPPKQEK